MKINRNVMRPTVKKTSGAWKYFKKVGDKKVICQICKRVFKFCGGTTNLNKHLSRRHEINITSIRKDYNKEITFGQPIEQDDPLGDVVNLDSDSEDVKPLLQQLQENNDNKMDFVKLNGRKSEVWKYYQKSSSNKFVACQLCNKVLRYHGGTTNLINHLKTHSLEISLYHTQEAYKDLFNTNLQPEDKICDVSATDESDVWNYFIKSRNNKFATCQICNKGLIFNGNTTNLNLHLNKIHPDRKLTVSVQSIENDATNLESDLEDVIPLQVQSSRKSEVWQYFEKNPNNDFVNCLICDKILKYCRGTSNLINHLKHHSLKMSSNQAHETDNNLCSLDIEDMNGDAMETNSEYSESEVWNNFKKSSDNEFAICQICNQSFKFTGDTTNLYLHMKIHSVKEEIMFVQLPENDGPGDATNLSSQDCVNPLQLYLPESSDHKKTNKESNEKKSEAWKYFRKDTSQNFVSCLICNKVFKYYNNTSNLIKHLRTLHSLDICLKQKSDNIGNTTNLVEQGKNDDVITTDSNQNDSEVWNHFKESENGQKSEIWQYFQKDANNESVSCLICSKVLKYNGISNLIVHLKLHSVEINSKQTVEAEADVDCNTTCLDIEYKDVDLIENSLIQNENDFENSELLEAYEMPEHSSTNISLEDIPCLAKQECFEEQVLSTERNNLNRSVVKMIVTDYMPLSFVENVGFLEFANKLNPLYEPPSTKLLTNLLPEIYSETRTKLKILLDNVQYVAITTDIWSFNPNKSYITVTCHYVYKDEVSSSVLGSDVILEPDQPSNIAKILLSIFEQWKIREKIVIIISNDNENIKNAVIKHLNYSHHPCIAHLLEFSINEAVDKNEHLKEILRKCKYLVDYFKSNTLDVHFPTIKVKKEPLSSVLMMQRLLEIKDSLFVAFGNMPELFSIEWNVISDCYPLLKPFEAVINELSIDQYPSISLVVPLVGALQSIIKTNIPKTPTGKLLQTTLLEAISRHLGNLEMNEIIAKATFLDPRLKKIAFETEESASNAQKWVCEELETKINLKHAKNKSTLNVSKTSSLDNESLSPWSYFDSKVEEVTTTSKSFTTANLMLRHYLELPYLNRKENPAKFCVNYKHIFPELYEMQLKYRCIPATSIPSERIFSDKGELINAKRNQLSPKNIDQIIFLNSNL